MKFKKVRRTALGLLIAGVQVTSTLISAPVFHSNHGDAVVLNSRFHTERYANDRFFEMDDLPPYHPDTMANLKTNANSKVETDYTVPSFTELRRRLTAANGNETDTTQDALKTALQNLKPNNMPYNVVATIYQDPTTKMAFNWFTNDNITDGTLEVVQGVAANHSAFANPLLTVAATSIPTGNLPYTHSRNDLQNVAGIANGATRSYTEHKALAQNLTPNTTYSFRVGKAGAWSEIGTFTTAKASKEPFSFIYTTDPQANTYDMFDVSQRTTHAAFNAYPNVNFWLHTGDLIESSGSANSEWEWEQLFETQQDLFLKYPIAPIIGNHDNSTNQNFTKHFFTDSLSFDRNGATKPTTPGSTYCYLYGDAIFFALNYESIMSNIAYYDSVAVWMSQQIAKHPNVKWRIAYGHKTMYTGSRSHQSDADGKALREKMFPVYDSLRIDLAIQAHDHIYEVIGPLRNNQLVPNAVSNQTVVTQTDSSNMTGKLGGIFSTENGTLYFLNNSSGKKKYWPRTQAEMTAAATATGIQDYFSFFNGRFGQTGNPTFSNVSVSTDTITITTYEVFENDSIGLFDEFKLVRAADASVCDTVSNIIVSNIANTSADIAWTAVSGQASWKLAYNAQGTATVTEQQVNNLPSVTLNNLLSNTTYEVRVQSLCGNDTSVWSNKVVFTTQQLGVKDAVLSSVRLTLNPNPASKQVTLTAEGIHEKCNITIVSLNGVVLLEQPFDCQTNNSMISDLKSFSEGIYFVRLQTEQGQQYVQKLVVQ